MEGSPPSDRVPTERASRLAKIIWRVSLISGFAISASIFAQAAKRDRERKKNQVPAPPAAPPAPVTAPPPHLEPVVCPPITRPVIERQPIPEEQQRELFTWILEEKRKAKPHNQQEKKRIDEEKAILKEFIRSKTVPRI